jgi:hypothetical protein
VRGSRSLGECLKEDCEIPICSCLFCTHTQPWGGEWASYIMGSLQKVPCCHRSKNNGVNRPLVTSKAMCQKQTFSLYKLIYVRYSVTKMKSWLTQMPNIKPLSHQCETLRTISNCSLKQECLPPSPPVTLTVILRIPSQDRTNLCSHQCILDNDRLSLLYMSFILSQHALQGGLGVCPALQLVN